MRGEGVAQGLATVRNANRYTTGCKVGFRGIAGARREGVWMGINLDIWG